MTPSAIPVLEALARQGGLGDGHPSCHQRLVHLYPILLMHRDLLAEDEAQGIDMRLGSHDQELVTLLEDGIRARYCNHPATKKPRDHHTVSHFLHDFAEAVSDDCGVLDLDMHTARHVSVTFFNFHLSLFLRQIYLEKGLEEGYYHDDADDSERICYGICRSHSRNGLRCGPGRRSSLEHHVRQRLLRGSQPGSIGHGTGHHAHHRMQALAGHQVDDKSYQNGQEYSEEGKQIKLDPADLEGVEESRADLKAYGEHEQDQAEILHEGKYGGIRPESEMAEQDGEEEYPGGTDGDALELEPGHIQPGSDDYGEQEDAVCNACPCKQFIHIQRYL